MCFYVPVNIVLPIHQEAPKVSSQMASASKAARLVGSDMHPSSPPKYTHSAQAASKYTSLLHLLPPLVVVAVKQTLHQICFHSVCSEWRNVILSSCVSSARKTEIYILRIFTYFCMLVILSAERSSSPSYNKVTGILRIPCIACAAWR